MADVALIQNGAVALVWRDNTAAKVRQHQPEFTSAELVETDALMCAGMLYDGSRFSIPASVSVPITQVTSLQFRRAIRSANLVSAFTTAYNALSADMQECWQYAHIIPRNSDFVTALQTAGGWSDTQVYNFFTKAATFPAN